MMILEVELDRGLCIQTVPIDFSLELLKKLLVHVAVSLLVVCAVVRI